MSNPEVQPKGHEQLTGASEAAAEQAEKLKSLEHSGERPNDSGERAKDARAEIEAIATERPVVEKAGGESGKSGSGRTKITKSDRSSSFNKTMKQVQSEMKPGERAFSKIIHTPAVEKTSNAVGATIARPNALLFGGIFAVVFVAFFYFFAKQYGFRLSGFETIGAFLLGWIVGNLYDFVKVMITGKRSS